MKDESINCPIQQEDVDSYVQLAIEKFKDLVSMNERKIRNRRAG